MKVGSRGFFYCGETHCLTTLFIILSKPDFSETISNVWAKSWVLLFRIHPLGSPKKTLTKNAAKKRLPSVKPGSKTLFGLINVPPVTVFAPTKLVDADWEALIHELAD